MAHMIDETTGTAAIAYVGKTPWHGLGQQLTEGASIQEWTEQARLNYSVLESPALFRTGAASEPQLIPNRKALYRSDTGAPLAVVSSSYHVVQPAEVMGFFGKLADIGGFSLETAGALSDGKRIWALARVGAEREIKGLPGDSVKPYLLLGTSYDGTMATVAKFTPVRVVCNNTITLALENEAAAGVRVLHRERFDADKVRVQLGIVQDSYEAFMYNAHQLAQRSMDRVECDAFVAELLAPYHQGSRPVRESRAFKRVMDLFEGAAIGSDIGGVFGTRWQALNAVTQLVDHERGRSDNTRLESAFFGTGATIKNRALDMLTTISQFEAV
jgi:phage/plasmid-like protein (TIGR03299 family)